MMQSYKEQRAELKAEQSKMSKDQLIEHLKSQRDEYDPTKPKFDNVIDLNNLPAQEHRWVDRGVVTSCEGGAHANHQVYKRSPM